MLNRIKAELAAAKAITTRTTKTTMLAETLTANKSSSSGFCSKINTNGKDARMMVAMTTRAHLTKINLVFFFAAVFAKRRSKCLLCRNKCCWYRCMQKTSNEFRNNNNNCELTARSYHAVVLKYLTTSFICAVYLQDNETPQLQWRLYSFVDKRANMLRRLPKELPRFISMTEWKETPRASFCVQIIM